MVTFVQFLIRILFNANGLPFRLRLQPVSISSKLGTLYTSNALSNLLGRIALVCPPIQPLRKPMSQFTLLRIGISFL